jgi:hypothetical protein
MSEQTHATAKTIKIPGPDHPITIERNLKRVVISVGGTVLADSHDALILHEADYSAVQYIPRKDVDMTLMRPTAPTRVTAHTSVSRQAGSAPSTPSGPTRLPTRSWRPSRTTWLSTRTGWTPSRSARPRAPASGKNRGRQRRPNFADHRCFLVCTHMCAAI